jgi:hypothetical protein
MDLTADGPEPASNLDAFFAGGPTTFQEAFPPACIRSHWDPTLVSRYVLPQTPTASLSLDPRQATRICTAYYTTSQGDAPIVNPEKDDAPKIPTQFLGPPIYRRPVAEETFVLPNGGAAGRNAPYHLYADNINVESQIYRMNLPLSRCKERKYVPNGAQAPDAYNTLPHVSQEFGLSPHAMYVGKQAGCRNQDDEAAWNRSGRLFFNHTRNDRVRPHDKNGPLSC